MLEWIKKVKKEILEDVTKLKDVITVKFEMDNHEEKVDDIEGSILSLKKDMKSLEIRK